MLKILEIDITKLYPIVTPTKFQNIIVPDESFFADEVGARFFTNEYRETIERIRNYAQKNSTPLGRKKFYFLHGRNKQIGEERLAKYFESKGYIIIDATKVPLEAELNILANCESFASTLGSCAHNMIFMKANSEVIFIPRSSYLAGYQSTLNDLQTMNINYIDSTLSIFRSNFKRKNAGPFCYIISDRLKKFFGDEVTGQYSDEDFIIFLAYAKYALSTNCKQPPETFQYYSTVFPNFFEQLKKRDDLMKKYGIFLK